LLDDEPRVFIDPVAVGLFPEAAEAVIRGQADQFLEPSWRRIRANFLLRSRQAEDSLAEAVARGVKQYVVLGAGLDTFAYRQPTWAKNIRIVEIDHPASQYFKIECLRNRGVFIPSNLHFQPVDFRTETLSEKLAATPLAKTEPIFVSWLGVTQYLSSEAIEGTLRAVASWQGGSEIVLEHIERLDVPGRGCSEGHGRCGRKSSIRWRALVVAIFI
jgi:methyltransferase (TIGR00027 family)